MRIAFVWFGIDGRYGHWRDGLWKAMQIIGKKHEVRMFEPTGNIKEFNPDWVLFWEAPICAQGKDKDMYWSVANLPFKKALLFAGGEINAMWVKDFDHIFVESQIDSDTCDRLGLPHSTAFGINDDIFKPEQQPKIWHAMHQATCASWKRQPLMAQAFRDKAIVCGRDQPTDFFPFAECRRLGTLVLPEQSAESVNSLLNASDCLCQTSEFWGGGQRATLEAIAAGVPVICMSDSPKNREYVEASGYGVVCNPDPQSILKAFGTIRTTQWDKAKARKYIEENWTGDIYAKNILKIIEA